MISLSIGYLYFTFDYINIRKEDFPMHLYLPNIKKISQKV